MKLFIIISVVVIGLCIFLGIEFDKNNENMSCDQFASAYIQSIPARCLKLFTK